MQRKVHYLSMPQAINEAHYIQALPSGLIAVDSDLNIQILNPAAEMLLGVSASQMQGQKLSSLAAFTPELISLCERVLDGGDPVTLFDHTLSALHLYTVVTIRITSVEGAHLLITIGKNDERNRFAANESKREIARVAGVMAAMLAHEVKNPLSGIRGAAQLLKEEIAADHQPLADLICKESDRIRDLLDQVELFSTDAPSELQPVNIHEALQYVIQVAQPSFARHVTFKESYDPSLPEVLGRRDLLVQLFLNLVKNSAEALAGKEDAVIRIGTSYKSGYKMGQTALPVAVTIEDNGPGIPESVRERLFAPFVTSKEKGRGLGLAIVAKMASDLGAMVELDEEYTDGARFTVWLPVANTR